MNELLKNQETSLLGRFKTIGFGFTLMLVWFLILNCFLSFILGNQIIPTHTLPSDIPYIFLFSCIFAPLWEELAFRVIPMYISKYFKHELLIPIILLSSVIFGWGHHYGSIGIFRQGVFGLIFSYVYIKNGFHYWSSVLLHFMWNFFCILFL